MNCPNCNEELLTVIDTEEQIIPLRQSDLLFPIEIMVVIHQVYKCNCGTTVKKPFIEHYDFRNAKPSKEN